MLFDATYDAAAAQRPRIAVPGAVGRISGGIRALLVVGGVIFLASLLGLASRHGFSVSFWPANAVLAGMMLRWRAFNRRAGWLGAMAGYIAADLLFGRTLSLAMFFASANLIGTLVAMAFLLQLDDDDLQLRRVHSVLRILAALVPGCLAAALCGALLVKVEFGGSPAQALLTWPASELVNHLVVLPIVLTMPWHGWRTARAGIMQRRGKVTWWPILLLALSCLAAIQFDGPGSIMFPMPALLLCAMTYRVAAVALITTIMGIGCLTGVGLGLVDIGQDMADPHKVVSVRIAIAFLVLVPLTISSAMAVRDDLMAKLRDVADHDGLTGLLTRDAFQRSMRHRLDDAARTGEAYAVLWLDIDHFKRINDSHGHPAGDAMLRMFAATARTCCRPDDLIGRIGGEEFALLVAVPDEAAGVALAEHLRQAFADQTILWNGRIVRATLSIAACLIDRPADHAPGLFKHLDEALYRAKRAGRDKVEWLGRDRPLPDPVPIAARMRTG